MTTHALPSSSPVRDVLQVDPRPVGDARAMVTVVVPCYNYADYLPHAVHSALSQHGVDVEVVIVDDASTDHSLEVAQALAASDARVRVLAHAENCGPVQTFNDGLATVATEFIVRLDADDLLTPGSLARAAQVCAAFPSVGLVYGHPIHFEKEPPPARLSAHRWTVWNGPRWVSDRCWSGVNVITSPEAFMRRSVVDQVGGQHDLAHTHDMEMWLRIAAVSDVAYVQGADQAWHREHARSLSNSAESAVGLTILEERRAAFETMLDAVADRLPQAEYLRSVAARTLASEALRRAAYEYDRRRADPVHTEALRAFALATYPKAPQLPAWRELERRVRWGDSWAVTHPWNLPKPLVRRATDALRYRRWHRYGVFERGGRLPRRGTGMSRRPRAGSPDAH